jgi:lipopolysaccharide export system protein LptA
MKMSPGNILVSFLLLLALPGMVVSQEAGPGTDGGSRIHITSDRLVSRQADHFAEFSGNVRATQENTIITAETLRVHFRESNRVSPGAEGSEDAIEKLVASGNVVIDYENARAFCEQAVYTTSDGLLVLSGEKVTITDGGSSITGQKIVLNRITGEIVVTGENDSRVEALFDQGSGTVNMGNQPNDNKHNP